MEKAYYKVYDKEFAQGLVSEWRLKREKVDAVEEEIKKEYGADGIFCSGDRIIAFGFKLKSPSAAIPGKRGFTSTRFREKSETFAVYRPNLRFKEGKEFDKKARHRNQLAEEIPQFSEFIVKKFGLPRFIVGRHEGSKTGTALFHSVAGVAKGILVVVIPFSADNPLPDVPQEFERIKKSEYVALTEE